MNAEPSAGKDAPIVREFKPEARELHPGKLLVEYVTEAHTVITCGPVVATPIAPADGGTDA